MHKIYIIGNGKMAKAMAQGMMDTFDVVVVGRDEKKLATLKQELADKITVELLHTSYDINQKNILLCVKPYALESVSSVLKGKAQKVLSSLAGVSIKRVSDVIDANSHVRVMPNLAAEYGKSMTTLTGDTNSKVFALEVCESFGSALWLDSEKELDIATGLAGSGPALLALVAESLADGAVRVGLKRADAQKLTNGLFDGVSELLHHTHPALLKDAVMSPGGTTAEGYAALEKAGVRSAFMDAIKNAYERAQKL